MAEKKDSQEKLVDDTNISDKKDVTKQDVREAELRDKASRRSLIIIVAVLTLLIIGLIAGAGVVAMRGRENRFADPMNGFGMTRITSIAGNDMPVSGSGQYVSTQATNDSVTTTVYNFKRGVVVAVNTDNIVIAGGGKQTTIKTNSSTVYTDSIKPAINDTVAITGTTADSTITAIEITVQN